MQLSEWLESQGRGAAVRLARACGCSPPAIRGISRGSQTPSITLAAAITRETAGAVQLDDLLARAPARREIPCDRCAARVAREAFGREDTLRGTED